MRPTEESMNGERFLILTRHNFHDWEFELENLCERKKVDDEKGKYAWLIKTLNSSDKRLVMKYKTGSIKLLVTEVDEKNEENSREIEIIGKDKPYKWAVEVLRKIYAQGNAMNEERLFEEQELAKDKIKTLNMASCSYDLDEYYKRFDRCVVAAQNIGCDLTEN
jgi:hypothetical protein